MTGVVVRTCAKVNLSLRVLGRREDGYHEVQTVMHAISLWDCIGLTPRQDDEIKLEVVGGEAPADETNMCWRAARLFGEELARASRAQVGGVTIELRKGVPVGAGLGGGSSDAAATLAGLARLWQRDVSELQSHKLAAKLGADVPFFLRGGCCLARGRGEILKPLPAVSMWLVLVVPDARVSTGEAYAALRRPGGRSPGRSLSRPVQRMVAAVKRGEVGAVARSLHNDFEALGRRTCRGVTLPGLAEAIRAKAALLSAGCVGAAISGSGSAAFGVARNLEEARPIAARLAREWPWVRVVHTVGPQESMVVSELGEKGR